MNEWPARDRWLRISVGMFGMILVAATVRLWFGSETDYPRIPLLGWGRSWPGWVVPVCAGLFVAGLLLNVFEGIRGKRRWGWGLITGVLPVAWVADQQTLQPWACQFWLMAVTGWLCGPGSLPLLRWLTIGIYFHSAVSKLDHAFVNGLGQTLLEGLAGALGISLKWWSAGARQAAALAMPVGELLVACGLVFDRTRKWGLIGSGLMHGLLLLAVGPWGLAHHGGVQFWNLFFVVQNVVLFLPAANNAGLAQSGLAQSDETGSASAPMTRNRLARGLILAALALPCLEWVGRFDVWPSWGLYSERAGRVVVSIPAELRESVPESLRKYVEAPAPLEEWSRVNLEQWAFDSRSAPAYPHERYKIGLAIDFAQRCKIPAPEIAQAMRVEVFGPPERLTGDRRKQTVNGIRELESFASRFLLNSRPR